LVSRADHLGDRKGFSVLTRILAGAIDRFGIVAVASEDSTETGSFSTAIDGTYILKHGIIQG